MSIAVESVVASVRERGLVPVKLQVDPANDDDRFWPFDGTLDEFLDVAKAMGSKAVYLVPYTFDKDLLEFTSDDEDTDDESEDSEYDDDDEEGDGEGGVDSSPCIDLVDVEPRLSAFTARVGEQFCISFVALTGEADLHFELYAPWYEEFSALREPAVERLRASADDRERAQAAAEEKRREAELTRLIEQLDRLPTDPEFRDLRTKAAMTAYVAKQFPDAKTVLGAGEFRDKVTELHNRAHLERSRR